MQCIKLFFKIFTEDFEANEEGNVLIILTMIFIVKLFFHFQTHRLNPLLK